MKLSKIVQCDTYIAVEAARPLFVPAAIIFVSSRSLFSLLSSLLCQLVAQDITTYMMLCAVLWVAGMPEQEIPASSQAYLSLTAK